MNNLADKYINPLTDFGFKKLFGSEPNKELLIDFLNQILPNNHRIKELNYSKNEQIGQTDLDRKAIFDLYCIGESGERFIVEVQKAKQNFFKDRSVYYASFPIQEQARKGHWDYRLQPVYTVGILDFIFDDHKQDPDLVHLIELKNQNGEVFYEKLKFIYIELPKFTKKADELETQFDRWLYVFRHLSELNNRPQQLQNRIFQKLFEVAEIAKFSPAEREAYQESLKYYRDLKNVVDTSREEGLEEGLEKGLEAGLAKGLEEGLVKGRAEGLIAAKIKVAKMMKEAGESLEKIIEYTNLTPEEVEKL